GFGLAAARALFPCRLRLDRVERPLSVPLRDRSRQPAPGAALRRALPPAAEPPALSRGGSAPPRCAAIPVRRNGGPSAGGPGTARVWHKGTFHVAWQPRVDPDDGAEPGAGAAGGLCDLSQRARQSERSRPLARLRQ